MLRCSAYCGTPPYMAPEILEKDINGKRSYDPMAAGEFPNWILRNANRQLSYLDIWALGVCLYAMVNKAYPFNPENMDSMIRNQREQVMKCAFALIECNRLNSDITFLNFQRFKFASKQKRMLSEECKNLITNMMVRLASLITFATPNLITFLTFRNPIQRNELHFSASSHTNGAIRNIMKANRAP